ncbi:MAG: metallophosphoesterase family protein [Akkermansia sp.]|nr:metallophosphoesterase family protein [Akkermansia sp.]
MPRIAIISDIHGNLHALCAVMEDVQAEMCSEVVCLGDVVGYCAYPRECLDYIRSLNCHVVKGNHDEEVAREDFCRMNAVARAALKWTREQLDEDQLNWLSRLQYQRVVSSLFTIVHSSLDFPKAWNYIFNANDAKAHFMRQFSPLCFHGHTHDPKVFTCTRDYQVGEYVDFLGDMYEHGRAEFRLEEGIKYFINVGSVGQPRDRDNRACYAVYDTDTRTVTIKRVPYDIEAAQQAILAVGLPEYLAERLANGC